MKTKKFRKAPICSECVQRIKAYGFICFDIMDGICTNTLAENQTSFDEKTTAKQTKTIVAFLERKGLLVTTETSETNVRIVPNLRSGKYDQDAKHFCWCKTT